MAEERISESEGRPTETSQSDMLRENIMNTELL